MTDQELDELERKAKAATAVHWGDRWADVAAMPGTDARQYIAAANPNTVLELIAEVRRLRGIEASARRLDAAVERGMSEKANPPPAEALACVLEECQDEVIALREVLARSK